MQRVVSFPNRIVTPLVVLAVVGLIPAAHARVQVAAAQAGTLIEETHAHRRPVILVPGLGSGAWVRKQVVPQLVRAHVVYALILVEDIALDFRAQMHNANLSIFEIEPRYAPDGEASPQTCTEAQRSAFWKSPLDDAPHATAVSISPAHHFAMIDQPHRFQQTLDGLLASL